MCQRPLTRLTTHHPPPTPPPAVSSTTSSVLREEPRLQRVSRATPRCNHSSKPRAFRTSSRECSRLCQRALTERRAVWGDDALERGHGAPLERTAQLGDALSGVGAVAITIDAAELVEGQAATGRRRSECQWALTERRTLGSWFERRAAYFSDCSVELPFSPSARAAPPSGRRLLKLRLRGGVQRWCGINGH